MIRHFAPLLAASLVLALSAPLRAESPEQGALWAARESLLAGDHAVALEVIVPLAEAGNPRAQSLLGAAYQHGLGLEADGQAAETLFRKAAARNYPPALFNLGILYERGGVGVAPDEARARAHFLAMAALDHPAGLTRAAYYLLEGIGGPQDTEAGLNNLRRAVELGDAEAHFMLAELHLRSRLVPFDLEEARRLNAVAAYQGHLAATRELARMRESGAGGPVDILGAHEMFMKAAGMGVGFERMNAAWLVFNHPEFFEDRAMALAMCLSMIVDDDTYVGACESMRAEFSEEDQRRAEEMAAAL